MDSGFQSLSHRRLRPCFKCNPTIATDLSVTGTASDLAEQRVPSSKEVCSGLLYETMLIPFENFNPRRSIITTRFKEAEIHISGVQSLREKI